MLGGAMPPRRLTIKRALRTTLAALEARHRSALLNRPDSDDASLPTEQFLHAVYELVSVHLVDLVDGLPRVGLVLDDELLTRLPLETAHRPDRPALFELTQCFRLLPTGGPERPPRRRRFRVEHRRADERGLAAVALERTLVGPGRPGERGLPLIHVAGHEPRVTAEGLRPDGHAHLVLSGCDSLPGGLPAGVASVVGTLWPVDDLACVTVMAAYHQRLSLGVGPLEALRQALLLHRPLPPDTWAAWAYLGHPD